MSRPRPRIESPDSKIPVFWMRTTGFLPPTHSPAAMAMVSPSRHTGTRSSDGSSMSISYMKLVSLSGRPYGVGDAVFMQGVHDGRGADRR